MFIKKIRPTGIILFMFILSLFLCNIGFAEEIGDMNGDGAILADDARTVCRYNLLKVNLPEELIHIADVNGDGSVSEIDAHIILYKSVKLEFVKEETSAKNDMVTKNGNQDTQEKKENISQGKNEYDILRNGKFYMKGSMIDEAGVPTPMEVAVGDDSVYMLTDFEGHDIGVLVSDNMYMIYPEEKCYLEISDLLLKMMGESSEDLIDVRSLKIFDGPPLSEASKEKEEIINGRKCKAYYFTMSDGTENRVYMDENRIIRFASYYASGKISTAYDLDEVSDVIPEGKTAPPSNYKKYEGLNGAIKFMKLLSEGIEQ